jgi:hypothetical protein
VGGIYKLYATPELKKLEFPGENRRGGKPVVKGCRKCKLPTQTHPSNNTSCSCASGCATEGKPNNQTYIQGEKMTKLPTGALGRLPTGALGRKHLISAIPAQCLRFLLICKFYNGPVVIKSIK